MSEDEWAQSIVARGMASEFYRSGDYLHFTTKHGKIQVGGVMFLVSKSDPKTWDRIFFEATAMRRSAPRWLKP